MSSKSRILCVHQCIAEIARLCSPTAHRCASLAVNDQRLATFSLPLVVAQINQSMLHLRCRPNICHRQSYLLQLPGLRSFFPITLFERHLVCKPKTETSNVNGFDILLPAMSQRWLSYRDLSP